MPDSGGLSGSAALPHLTHLGSYDNFFSGGVEQKLIEPVVLH